MAKHMVIIIDELTWPRVLRHNMKRSDALDMSDALSKEPVAVYVKGQEAKHREDDAGLCSDCTSVIHDMWVMGEFDAQKVRV